MHSLHQFAAVDRFGKAGKVSTSVVIGQLSAFLRPLTSTGRIPGPAWHKCPRYSRPDRIR